MKKLYYWKFTADAPFDFDVQFFPAPAFNPVMDFHDSIHLNLILDHGMDGKVGNTLFHLERYDLQVTAPWELHGENRMKKGLRLLSITADPDMLLENLIGYREAALSLLLLEPRERHRIINSPATRELRMERSAALPAISGDDPEIIKIRRWLAIQGMLAELLHCIKAEDLPEASFRLYRKVAPALALFKSGRQIALQEAADACALSASRFRHIFRQACRMSFSEFEMRNRLSHAGSLLRQGLHLKDVAEQTGFYDSSHLTRFFRRYLGMTPGKFR